MNNTKFRSVKRLTPNPIGAEVNFRSITDYSLSVQCKSSICSGGMQSSYISIKYILSLYCSYVCTQPYLLYVSFDGVSYKNNEAFFKLQTFFCEILIKLLKVYNSAIKYPMQIHFTNVSLFFLLHLLINFPEPSNDPRGCHKAIN